jgi:hypothetical protein
MRFMARMRNWYAVPGSRPVILRLLSPPLMLMVLPKSPRWPILYSMKYLRKKSSG